MGLAVGDLVALGDGGEDDGVGLFFLLRVVVRAGWASVMLPNPRYTGAGPCSRNDSSFAGSGSPAGGCRARICRTPGGQS